MISVIVPVYNVEKYVVQCIESVLCQTYTDFELILVDDGSTDSSGVICDEYASRDNRIKVIHKENGGGARGAVVKGVAHSSGEYIYFVDSDDYIKPETLEILLDNIKKYSADCIQYQAIYVQDDFENAYTKRTLEIIEGDRFHKEIIGEYLHTGSTSHTQWSYGRHDKFYSAELIKKVIPYLDINVTLCEDIEMSLWVALFCKKAVILEDTYLYYWRFVTNSISRKIVSSTIPKHTYFLSALQKFADKNGFSDAGLATIGDNLYIDLMITTVSRNLPVLSKVKTLRELKGLITDKNNIRLIAQNHSFITCNMLKYISRFDCFVPAVLSQIYIKIKK